MKQKQKPQRRAKIPQQQRHAPAAAITFRTNVICEDATGKLIFLQAGQASPWKRLEDVPPRLQAHIGSPEDRVFHDTENQHWTPKEHLQMEEEELQRLNAGGNLDPEVKQALDERNLEHLEVTKARSQTLTAAADRADEAVDRIAAEHEAENEQTYKQLGSML